MQVRGARSLHTICISVSAHLCLSTADLHPCSFTLQASSSLVILILHLCGGTWTASTGINTYYSFLYSLSTQSSCSYKFFLNRNWPLLHYSWTEGKPGIAKLINWYYWLHQGSTVFCIEEIMQNSSDQVFLSRHIQSDICKHRAPNQRMNAAEFNLAEDVFLFSEMRNAMWLLHFGVDAPLEL